MKTENIADGSGVLGAVFAALCCAGVPFIVAGLAALGLSFLRKDAILWPLMFASLLVALWGFWSGRQFHGSSAPVILAVVAGTMLVAGVVFVHGFPAREMIWAGSFGLVAATVWNITKQRAYATRATRPRELRDHAPRSRSMQRNGSRSRSRGPSLD